MKVKAMSWAYFGARPTTADAKTNSATPIDMRGLKLDLFLDLSEHLVGRPPIM